MHVRALVQTLWCKETSTLLLYWQVLQSHLLVQKRSLQTMQDTLVTFSTSVTGFNPTQTPVFSPTLWRTFTKRQKDE
jgi:hypothetical protein